MSKILKFDVTLNHPTGIYHPGDPLSGTINLKIRDDIPCYGKCRFSLIVTLEDQEVPSCVL